MFPRPLKSPKIHHILPTTFPFCPVPPVPPVHHHPQLAPTHTRLQPPTPTPNPHYPTHAATTRPPPRRTPPTPLATRNHPPRPIVGNKESPYMDVRVRHRAPPLTPIPSRRRRRRRSPFAAAVRRPRLPFALSVRAFRFGGLPFFYCVVIAHFFPVRFYFTHLSLSLFLFSQTFRKVSTR